MALINADLLKIDDQSFQVILNELVSKLKASGGLTKTALGLEADNAVVLFQADKDVNNGVLGLDGLGKIEDHRMTNILIDEDDMISDSLTKAPTQQSVKAFVETFFTGAIITDSDYTASAGHVKIGAGANAFLICWGSKSVGANTYSTLTFSEAFGSVMGGTATYVLATQDRIEDATYGNLGNTSVRLTNGSGATTTIFGIFIGQAA